MLRPLVLPLSHGIFTRPDERKVMWDTLFSAAGVVGIHVYVQGEDTDG